MVDFSVVLCLIGHFVHLTSGVLDKPSLTSEDHVNNDGGVLTSTFFNENLSNGLDSEIKTFFSLSAINVRDSPPLDVAIMSGSYIVVTVLKQNFDEAIVKGSLPLNIKHKMRLDELTFPNNEVTILTSTDNLTIWQFIESSLIRQFELAEFSDFTLELKTCESLGHFPELNVT